MPAVSECHGASLVSMENGQWLKCAACQQPCEGISDEQDDSLPFGDQLNIAIDRAKIQKLVDDGVITPAQLANAPILEIDPPDGRPEPMRVRNVTCQTDGCGKEFKTLEQFEEHLAVDHMGLTFSGED